MTDKQHIISFNLGSGEGAEQRVEEIKQKIKIFCAETKNIPQGVLLQGMTDFCLTVFRDQFQAALMESIVEPEPEPIPVPVPEQPEIVQTGEPGSTPPEDESTMETIMAEWIKKGDVVQCPSGVSSNCTGYVHKTALQNGICPKCYEQAQLAE